MARFSVAGRRAVVAALVGGARRSTDYPADGSTDEGAFGTTTASARKGTDPGPRSGPCGCPSLGRSASDESERTGEKNPNKK